MTALPIEPLIPEILATLQSRGRLVLQAPPGAGKTTRLPLALLDAPFLKGKKIIVLEPRRLAARLAARFMAGQLGEEVGERVGYRVRLESKVGPKTRVELVTDGLYLRRLQEDPGLEGVGCILFDEFHERGLESDLALALTLEAASLNPDLKLIVMSATLDAQPVAKLLGDAPILTSQGRAFPVETLYLPRAPEDRMEDVTARAVKRALAERDGSLLVFLPGQAEIRRVAERLSDLPAGVILAPLYGDLDLKVQDAAVKPAPAGQRKVVLATSIAETSLTIEGIGVVIDSGLARQPRYDPKSGMTRLETLRASQATAEQRRGRAGRLGPGTCYRLWTEADQRARPQKPQAEIAIADLAGFALELASWGAGADLALLDPPPPGTLAEARALLVDLGALDGEGRITTHGKAMAGLGLHPRLAHMILAAKPEERRLACDLAALLGERDPIKGPPAERPADMQLRLDLLRGERGDVAGGVDRGVIARARQLAKQWAGQVRAPVGDPSATPGGLLALAYPDRLAQRRDERGRFRLSNGKGASLKPHDTLAGEEFLAVAELDGQAGEARIFLAAALSRQELETRFASRLEAQDILAWSSRDEAVEAKRQRRLGALILDERALKDPDPEKLQAALEDGIRQMGLAVLPWSESSLALRQRLSFLHRHRPQDWPTVDDEALLANLPQWLGPFLSGKSRRSHLASIDLQQALLVLLDHRQRRELDRLAPARLSVPTGREVAIDYAGDHPVLAVKLQEMFGQKSSPRVLDGQVAVVLHLLSPAGRPLQVTSDLEGFWKGTYAQVRADMRGRYPRHPWPDNPLEAPPQRGLKRR